MICLYKRNKTTCDWANCPARMYVKNPIEPRTYMRVCAIAYAGTKPIDDSNEEENK